MLPILALLVLAPPDECQWPLAISAWGAVVAASPADAGAEASSASAPSPEPDGYATVEAPALPDRLVEIMSDSTFSILIDREVAAEGHRRMIHTAERLVPTAEHLDEILEAGHGLRMTRGNWPDNLQKARDAEAEHGPRWWWITWDHTFLPVALSAPAVHHYVDLLRSRAVRPNPFSAEEDHRGHLTYSARVESVEGEKAGESPWVVVLEIQFSYWCGPLCALTFAHDRRVYFDAAARPTRVEGDRVPDVRVS